MDSNVTELDRLALERAAIVRMGNLHWFHWAVVLLSLLLTIGAWYFTNQQIDEKATIQFERASKQVVELVSERMKKYEDGLWGGVAAIHAQGDDMAYEEWRVFAESLRIDLKYPGINGIGIIHHVAPKDLQSYLKNQRRWRPDYRIHPKHDRSEYLPITYIEPSRENAKAVGLDMAHEANRYGAAVKARDSGAARITGPIVLVQDSGQTPGFLFYAPFYSGGTYDTVQGRRNNFLGMVYAPFVVHKLMEGVLKIDNRQVRIRIKDSEDVLYDERGEAGRGDDGNGFFTRMIDLNIYGRTWNFEIWATPSLRESLTSDQPLIILFGGIFIDSLLLALFIFLTRANRRAVSFADRTTQQLKIHADALEKTNIELERFAYVASHDLRSPLRNIDNLAEWVEEDLGDALQGEPRENLKMLRARVARLDHLLDDLLTYSKAGREKNTVSTVDTKALVDEITELLQRPEEITVAAVGDFPKFETVSGPLERVLRNLIDNAIKHHDLKTGRVEISATEQDDFYRFSISDDGPGIDPMFHAKVFDMFQTLKSRDEIEGSGLGLPMVKKVVEQHGGHVWLESDSDTRGATFHFDWPKKSSGEAA